MCTFGFAAVYYATIACSTALPWASVLLHIVMVTSPAGGGQSFGVAAMSGALADVATEPAGLLVEEAGDGAIEPPAHDAPMRPSVKSDTTNDRRTIFPLLRLSVLREAYYAVILFGDVAWPDDE